MLQTFMSAVDALDISPTHYEIIVAGDWQQQPDGFNASEALGAFLHVCGACEFSDKIRAIFEIANHEFVWVSHDYVISLPSFYAGMRSFGRRADWLVPGVFQISEAGNTMKMTWVGVFLPPWQQNAASSLAPVTSKTLRLLAGVETVIHRSRFAGFMVMVMLMMRWPGMLLLIPQFCEVSSTKVIVMVVAMTIMW